MKIASFTVDGRPSYGVVDGDRIVEASPEYRGRYPDLRSALSGAALTDLRKACVGPRLEFAAVRFLPTIPNPDKVLCVGVNYRSHLEEHGWEPPGNPLIFVRFAASQTGHGEPIVKPRVSEQFDFEGELAVIIGRPARHVRRESALDYVAGYCCFMDGSVRDWQTHTIQFTPGKNFHRSGSMGPWLVTRDAVPDPSVLTLETRVNGEIMQQGRLDELIFDIPALIEYCSTFAELLPGDVIATGTPGGVGAARKPPVWLKPRDRVAVTIDGIGSLENLVREE